MTETNRAGRFEWERVLRRMQIPGEQKYLALVLATYADPDGSRVRPGNDTLAAVIGRSEKTVRRHLSALRTLGMLEQKTRGGGRGGKGTASEYQLTIPTDLLDRVDMLGPGDKSPDTQMSGQSAVDAEPQPVDNPESPDTQMSTQSDIAAEIDRTHSAQSDGMTGHSCPNDRTPRCPPTTHDHPQQRPELVVTTQGESRPRARIIIHSRKSNHEQTSTPLPRRPVLATRDRRTDPRQPARPSLSTLPRRPRASLHRGRTHHARLSPEQDGADMIYEARCGYCDETHVFATADQRSQWLDYHWADAGCDPDNAFLLDRPELSTADETHHHPDPTPRGRTRRNPDASDRLSAYIRGRLCRCGGTGEHCPVHSSADHRQEET